MAGATQAAGDPAFSDSGSRSALDLRVGLLCRARIRLGRRSGSSLFLRIGSRPVFRLLRRAALWCWGVGDDVEIVGDGLHGGSSFC